MMLDGKEHHKQLAATPAGIGKTNPDTVRSCRDHRNAPAKLGKLDPKTRKLIALAVGTTRQCDGCIITRTDAAIKNGATREEVMEALGVAIAVNAGAALVFSARAMDAYFARKA